jgi:hypothetical protein
MANLHDLTTVHPATEPHQRNKHLARLLAQMKIAYRQAGEPSYRTLAALAGPGLSASTISRIFNATKPPRWCNVARLLAALGVPAQELVSVWHPLWQQAVDKIKPIHGSLDPAHEPLTPHLQQDKTCARCGASIADPAIHTKWHLRLGRAEELLEALERNSKRGTYPPPRLTGQPVRVPRRNGATGPGGAGRNAL